MNTDVGLPVGGRGVGGVLRLLREGTNHSHFIAHVLDRALYSEGFLALLTC